MCVNMPCNSFILSLCQNFEEVPDVTPLEIDRFFEELKLFQQQSFSDPTIAVQRLDQFSNRLLMACSRIHEVILPIIRAEQNRIQPDLADSLIASFSSPGFLSRYLPEPDGTLALPYEGTDFEFSDKKTIPIPSVADFMATFSKRPLTKEGYKYSRQEHERDKKILTELVREHNGLFLGRIMRGGGESVGETERLDLPTGSTLFVRADLHGDVATLIHQLEFLRIEGFLNPQYRCTDGFHMLFLGDYCDRGHNDIETLSMILKLRMENPISVHLIHGNHEDLSMQIDSEFSEESEWLQQQRPFLSACYTSLPLAICVGDTTPTEKGRREFAHFSHGLVQTVHNLSPLISGKRDFLPISFGTRRPVIPYKDLSDKQFEAANKIQIVNDQIGYSGEQSFMHLWGEVGLTTEPSRRGRGHVLAVDDLRAYAQFVATKTGVIKTFFEGHVHKFTELSLPRKHAERSKVFNTTLPIAIVTGPLREVFSKEILQGMLLTVAPKIEGWTKEAIIYSNQRFERTGKPVGMYEPIPFS